MRNIVREVIADNYLVKIMPYTSEEHIYLVFLTRRIGTLYSGIKIRTSAGNYGRTPELLAQIWFPLRSASAQVANGGATP